MVSANIKLIKMTLFLFGTLGCFVHLSLLMLHNETIMLQMWEEIVHECGRKKRKKKI